MAVEDIIGRGVGFSPGGIKFIVMHGFSAETVTQSNSPGTVYGMDENGKAVQRPSVIARPRPEWWFD